jgi:hypothetical protein
MVLRLRPADATVDRPFSEPNKQDRCGVFEIVSINVYGVYDPMNMRYKRYSPQVLAAMAGTEQLVQRRLGMVSAFGVRSSALGSITNIRCPLALLLQDASAVTSYDI